MLKSCRPISEHAIAQNVFIKIMTFTKAGDRNLFHKHAYDHLTVLSAGALEIRCDGQVGRFRAPHLFLTPKDGVHQFIALEDETIVSCIHAIRDPSSGDEIVPNEASPAQINNILTKRSEAVAAEVAARKADANGGLGDGYLSPGDSWQPDSKGWCASNASAALCANTLVSIHVLTEKESQKVLVTQMFDRVAYLSVGALQVISARESQTYHAPHVLVVPAGQAVTIESLSNYSILVEIQPLRGEDKQPDQIPAEITLEYASQELSRVLAQIEEQTTVIIPGRVNDNPSLDADFMP